MLSLLFDCPLQGCTVQDADGWQINLAGGREEMSFGYQFNQARSGLGG